MSCTAWWRWIRSAARLKTDDNEGLDSEFDASVRRTQRRVNQRAAARGRPLVTESEILILIVSGTRKLGLWSG